MYITRICCHSRCFWCSGGDALPRLFCPFFEHRNSAAVFVTIYVLYFPLYFSAGKQELRLQMLLRPPYLLSTEMKWNQFNKRADDHYYNNMWAERRVCAENFDRLILCEPRVIDAISTGSGRVQYLNSLLLRQSLASALLSPCVVVSSFRLSWFHRFLDRFVFFPPAFKWFCQTTYVSSPSHLAVFLPLFVVCQSN